MKYVALLLLIILNPSVLLAQSSEQLLISEDMELTIKPNICVAPRGESTCISSIDINWTSRTKGNFCLASSYDEHDLFCWIDETSGFYRHKLIFNKDVLYSMSNKISHKTIVEAIMKFKVLKPHRGYKKRRSRFPWSLSSL